jgi:hypothetical protein
LIAQGVAVVSDEKVRRECCDLVITSFPYAEISALMARLAGEAGTRGGHIQQPTWRLPDFRRWGCSFTLSTKLLNDISAIGIPSVHHGPIKGFF